MTDRLGCYLVGASGERFAWGRSDCMRLAAHWLDTLTERDEARFLPRYRTEAEALAIVAEAGGWAALVSAHVARWGLEPVASPRRGDLVLCDTAEGPTLGIATGPDRVAVPARRGGLAVIAAAPRLGAWGLR